MTTPPPPRNRIPRRPVEMPWTAEDEAIMASVEAAREAFTEEVTASAAILNDPDAWAADDARIDAEIARALRQYPAPTPKPKRPRPQRRRTPPTSPPSE